MNVRLVNCQKLLDFLLYRLTLELVSYLRLFTQISGVPLAKKYLMGISIMSHLLMTILLAAMEYFGFAPIICALCNLNTHDIQRPGCTSYNFYNPAKPIIIAKSECRSIKQIKAYEKMTFYGSQIPHRQIRLMHKL